MKKVRKPRKMWSRFSATEKLLKTTVTTPGHGFVMTQSFGDFINSTLGHTGSAHTAFDGESVYLQPYRHGFDFVSDQIRDAIRNEFIEP